jgi:LPXTG-motif cell wall-anchored protein
MVAEIVTASISAAGALLVAVAGYYFTKKREREADWRKEKLSYYKAFVSSLSKALEGVSSSEGLMQCATASNDLLLFAPQPVIVALRALQEEIRPSNMNRSKQKHDELLSRLFYEMRADIGVNPQDDPATFAVELSSGVRAPAKPG